MFDSILGFNLKALSALFSSAMFLFGLFRLLNSTGTRLDVVVGVRKFTGQIWAIYAEPVSFYEIAIGIRNKGSVTAELTGIDAYVRFGRNRPMPLPLTFRNFKSRTIEVPANGEWGTSIKLSELYAILKHDHGEEDLEKDPKDIRIRFIVRDQDKHRHQSEWYRIPTGELPTSEFDDHTSK